MEEKEFNLDEFEQEFNDSWTEDEEVVEEVEETTDETEEEVEEVEEETETTEESETSEQPPAEEDKRNRAFADLRRQAEQNKKYADLVQKIAEQNGVSPDEIMKRYEEQQLQKQAEKENVPVEVMKRLNALEQENQQVKDQQFRSTFNQQVAQTIEKYKADESKVQETFKYMQENGIDPRTTKVPFEQIYKMAHMDEILEQRINETRQKELSEKKKRRESTALPSDNSVSQDTDDIGDEVLSFLKEEGHL